MMPTENSRVYGSLILDHFRNPRNTGIALNFNRRYLERHNPWLVRILLTLRVADGLIQEARFQAKSCVTTTAAVSALTEIVHGKTVDEALSVTPERLSEYLEIVPPEKMYSCRLAVATLRHALNSPCTDESAAELMKGARK